MNNFMSQLTVRQRFIALLLLLALSLLTYGAWSFKTLQQLQINSPLYHRIVQGKDLVADVLPPPEYIVESFVVTLELVNNKDKDYQRHLIEKLRTLKDEYYLRHDFWLKQNLTDEFADLLVVQSYQQATDFYNTAFNDLIPAVLHSDSGAIANNLSHLTSIYKAHRNVIDQIIPLVNSRVASDEQLAAQQTQKDTTLMLVILAFSLLGSVAVGFLIAHSILKQLGGEPHDVVAITEKIAQGNLSNTILLKEGDTTSLLASIDAMQHELHLIISQLKNQVERVVQGDFSHQIDLSDAKGFEHDIGATLNRLSESLLRKIGGNPDMAVLAATKIASGNLNVELDVRENDNHSILAAMKIMTANLQSIISDIERSVDTTSKGDFSYRMNEDKHLGYAKTIAELLNRLNSTSQETLIDISRISKALAEGDLTQRIDKNYPGLFGDTAKGINTTRDYLLAMIHEIVDSVAAIHSSASQIAVGNLDLSQRTEQQAASLEENSSSMQELAVTVKNNAENARLGNQMASAASNVATKGGKVVNEVVSTMHSIEESSKKIVDIIAVIDSISFQTNILALNAAVEAARAGEQGRGFAVVAGEVRTLAQKSAAAAKEIKQLISDSVAKVEVGSELVHEAGTTMGEIVSSVRKVTDIMDEISAASNEQSSGIDEVNRAITQMDEVTQQNASLVEQSAAAAASLEDQARSLMRSISVFKLEENQLQTHVEDATKTASLEEQVQTLMKSINVYKSTHHSGHTSHPRSSSGKTKKSESLIDDSWKEF